jgi:gliding motility-associated-like protein
VAFPTVTTIYSVQIVNQQFGQHCEQTFTMELQVKPSPTSAFSYTRHACDAMIFFTDESFDDIVSWQWDFGGSGSSTLANTSYFFPKTGTHSVVLTVTNVHGCKARRGEPIFVTTVPVSVSAATNICRGGSTQLEASGGVQYEWMPEETLSDPNIHNPVATPSVSSAYSVIVTTNRTNSVTGLPCEYTLSTQVKVSTLTDLALAGAFATPTVVLKGNHALLVYTGDPGAVLPAGSTSPQIGYSVSAQPSGPTVYTASVVREACSGRFPVAVDVRANTCNPGEIFIPNTFTPNGDGNNDLLRIRGLAVDEIYFTVYNRWGEMVFETRDKQQGWDGSYNGKDADVGVFGWYLTVKCFNGEETFRKGNVTLIR